MKCEICEKEILTDSQCINYKYYHNKCIINLAKENKILKEALNKILECKKEDIMMYDIKLSKGKININDKEYDIPDEVAEFIIYETNTRDDIIQTRDVYERTIDKIIEYVEKAILGELPNGETYFLKDDDVGKELLDILKVVR